MTVPDSVPTADQLTAALSTVIDPEIRRPITEIGMLKSAEVDADGIARVGIYLTVAGCPMKETLTRDITAKVGALPGVLSAVATEDGLLVRLDTGGSAQRLVVELVRLEVPVASVGPHRRLEDAFLTLIGGSA